MSDDEGPSHKSSPYPLSRLSPRYELVDIAREIQSADAMLGTVVGGKLDLIAEQIRGLQQKAHALMKQAQRAGELHRVSCNFKKTAGATYHLYERPGGARYFSILSPFEWGDNPPHTFIGSYRLEADMSFVCLDEPGADSGTE